MDGLAFGGPVPSRNIPFGRNGRAGERFHAAPPPATGVDGDQPP